MGQVEAALSGEKLSGADALVGDILRRTRESYNQSLRDVEKNLRIRACQIEAIEKNDFEQLPGRVYTIGFVRSYAEYLGLDGDQVVSILKAQFDVKTIDPALDFPVGATDGKFPRFWLIAASIITFLLVVGVGTKFLTQDRTIVDEVPALSEVLRAQLPEQVISVKPVEEKISAGQTVTPVKIAQATQNEIIILNVLANSWVEIKDEAGVTLVSRVLKKGERFSLPEETSGLTISMGNAGGIALEIGDKTLGALGQSGETKKDMPLDKDFLLKTYP